MPSSESSIPEAEIIEAMDAVRERLGETIEPSAAVAFAAARVASLAGARVGVICSGGNVSP